uniref:Vta1/callose synthase N-terminal domain-containing protein n=1 Tax=Trieres chinensis TaxID=1514140 RepID=A0A7S1ZCU8_TRICV|mmetsp:Transcript_22765/g.46200  ORF Transcript_22765/g.46200 Transcript_22765/m.46200 type:complete len:380 (+) Transcript_22765:138-1277(+)|eukprot:CAMPEP_0183291106 /NCGR_PEP_ID=MMETSP0160_2-20130417/640_1 /TAXON_ID=2839 ORGANISM="Odontella Sinensis, Strain Grunow 1884" /NCGR_SAMPLE_ID=MMETSP0160_2 /ASSEMBLY_ACC=CAM_ASM_000250 /LENGTH=379 /DNA_ID=CAMNT_0025451861 /DNA_START=134 /DNA_END=1276 /DNA_ORIENTATION=+
MPLKIPPELKKITTFVRRAEELDRDKANPESRVVAYYCRQFAVQAGIPLAASAEGKGCLGELLGQLESEKAAMSVFSRDESRIICRRFADKIFSKADGEDRAGAADKGTARTFYAAASFFEILQQFYDVKDEELKSDEQKEEDEKRVYCKWKATEILKAIREGRKPTPGGFGETEEDGATGREDAGEGEGVEKFADEGRKGEDDDEGQDVFVPPPPPAVPPSAPEPNSEEHHDRGDEEGTEVGLNGRPHDLPPPPYPVSDGHDDEEDVDVFVPGVKPGGGAREADTPPPYQPPAPAPVPPPPMPAPSYSPPAPKKSSAASSVFGGFRGKKKGPGGGGRVSQAAFEDATELTRFALTALQEKDAELAAERLRGALQALGG